ncbi:MFS transporter small subunit [Methylotuvimicrobium sp.]|uniref:MFS transporter small subunit n=1 Tax=Methylotuvimicrobium sp. TaxID=2822413 RepID=UPI003D65E2A2
MKSIICNTMNSTNWTALIRSMSLGIRTLQHQQKPLREPPPMKNSKPFKPGQWILLLIFWLYVAIPLIWGVWSTLRKSMILFN